MEELPAELKGLLTTVAKKNGIENYTVEFRKDVSKEGEGYIGILDGLCVIDKDSDKRLNFVLKTAPKSKQLRKQFPIRAMFLREIYVYEKLFPEFLSFQEQYTMPTPFKGVPKMFGAVSDEFNELLLLENLQEDGYRLSNRKEPMDSQHLSLVMASYARWHALSFAMRHLEPERFEEVVQPLRRNVMEDFREAASKNNAAADDNDDNKPDPMSEVFFSATLEALKNRPKELNAIRNVMKDWMARIFTDTSTDNGRFVVCHADCWSANIMFKYQNEKDPLPLPTQVCLIDWQLATTYPPIWDLSYFFYICAAKEDLWNYRKYLDIYYAALSENLTAFGLDPAKVYPFELFLQNWKSYSKAGFFMVLLMLPQSLSDKETHNFAEVADKGQNVFDVKLKRTQNCEKFNERIVDLVEFLIENDFL